ncbi:MAG: serine/threonine-protein kinase [Polyangia bacterium]|jgi:serine/threonine-protein kinase
MREELLGRGVKLGRYEIRDPIGHGGTGDVYRAWDTDLEREVAVKVLREVEGLERFEREAELLSKVDSENVVRIQDFRLHGAHPYIVMELLRGVSLRDRLAEGAMGIAEGVGVVLGVCRGVAACHRLGIVHRDLKPANVFLATTTHRGTVAKVLDFGLAKPRSCDIDTTAPGQIPGTPAYMAPELLRGLAADELSDQYSVGLLLYLALTGKRPFGDKEKAELALAIMRSGLVPPKEARPDLPEDLVVVLLRAVSGERAARFPSIMALGRALVPFASVEERGLALELFDEGMGPEDAGDVTTAIGKVAPRTGAATVVAPIGQMAELARRSVELPDVPAEGERARPPAGWSGRVVAVVAPMEEDHRRGLMDLPYVPSDVGVGSSLVVRCQNGIERLKPPLGSRS